MNFSPYTTQTNEEVASALHVNVMGGLSTHEIKQRGIAGGINMLPEKTKHWYGIIGHQFRSSFIYLLVCAAAVALALGERWDGIMIFLFVAVNASVGFYQEYRSEQTVRLLKQYLIPRTKVRRDGKEQMIESKELVVGDIVILSAGDHIPADVRIIEATDVMVNESSLTGESSPISKNAGQLKKEAGQIFEATNMGFAGTSLVSGRALGIVVAVGTQTSLGNIAHLVGQTNHTSSFEKGMRQFSNFILRFILITIVIILTANLIIKGDAANPFELILFAIALTVSVIPEALPVVTTFCLARGASRLVKQKVIIKRLSAIEDLGSIDVLCTDKTGTLTENHLTVDGIYGDEEAVLCAAALASPHILKNMNHSANSFDQAIIDTLNPQSNQCVKDCHHINELPFDPLRRRNSMLVECGGKRRFIVRGAAESVLSLCTLAASQDQEINIWIKEQGVAGKRIIVIGERDGSGIEDNLAKEEKEFHFLGCIAFADPLKKSALQAVSDAKNLGVAIKILTGDSPDVAGAIARQLGMITSNNEVVTGAMLDALPTEKQHTLVRDASVFARVTPDQKYKIVMLLQENAEVGFLGEGINDAPALQAATVGIVVQDATDIAREAADIILLKKSLTVIVDGIREGREVFANTTKYIRATLSSNFGNFFAVSAASLLTRGLPLLPVQILLLNLLSDAPMIAIATDTVDGKELKKPRGYDVKDIALSATVLGIVSTVFDFIYFALFRSGPISVLQTNWFIGSVITELLFLFSIRTPSFFLKAKAPPLSIIAITMGVFALTLFIPFTQLGQTFFHFVPPTQNHIFIILGVAIVYFVTTELVKFLYYHRVTTNPPLE